MAHIEPHTKDADLPQLLERMKALHADGLETKKACMSVGTWSIGDERELRELEEMIRQINRRIELLTIRGDLLPLDEASGQ